MNIKPMTVLAAAERIKPEIIKDRRKFHSEPETGNQLPHTKEYVMRRLLDMGYHPAELCESGIVATITGGKNEKCILLRADMDGLKVEEKTNLVFRSMNGNMHACGHDMHTAMLLGAAKLLREFQEELGGTVKLVFQPDEEGFTGAKAMLAAGVLKDPAPQAAMALHVHSGTPSGMLLCGRGVTMAGCTLFRITVKGIGCHGAMPETGIDPLNIAAHIFIALQEINARETPAKQPAVITIGKMSGGQAPNIVPQEAVLEGTIRTFDRDLTNRILSRIETISTHIAEAFRGQASVQELASAPPLKNDVSLANQMADYAEELFGQESVYRMDDGGMGSEDFASYTYELPCSYILMGAGAVAENPLYGLPMHNEKVVFNEDILTRGAALHTYCALRWLG